MILPRGIEASKRKEEGVNYSRQTDFFVENLQKIQGPSIEFIKHKPHVANKSGCNREWAELNSENKS